jgi:hypothetical protein
VTQARALEAVAYGCSVSPLLLPATTITKNGFGTIADSECGGGALPIYAAIGTTRKLSRRTNFWILGWGGLTVLGAVDSLPLGITEKPEEEEESNAGQGVSEGGDSTNVSLPAQTSTRRHLPAPRETRLGGWH